MQEHRNHLIAIATSEAYFMKVCRSINSRYAEDLFQEVCIEVLTMPEERLPLLITFRSWFYRTAFNMMTATGKLGKVVKGHENASGHAFVDRSYSGNKSAGDASREARYTRKLASGSTKENEPAHERNMKRVEQFMLSLPEFDNRVAILYNELGNMKSVHRATGISYSACRAVKEKLKALR